MRVFDLLKSNIDKMEEKRDIKGLILALNDDDKVIRQGSARALGNIGSNEATEPLTQTLQDPDKEVREEAITALGRIGDPQATPPLIEALNNQDVTVRWRAAQALGKIGSKEATEPLTQTLQDPDKEVREEAKTALCRITINPFIEYLESSDLRVKEETINEINQLDKICIPRIIKASSNADTSTKDSEDDGSLEAAKLDQLEEDVSVKKETETDNKIADFNGRRKELEKKGYYNFIRNFVDKFKYDYQENFVDKTGYSYQPSDLQKLKNLLEYKGINFNDEEILQLVQDEIEKQEYQDFEEKILENHPTAKKEYLENYIKNYPQDTAESIENLKELLERQVKSIKNLEKEIEKIRQQKEIEEFQDKLLQSPIETTTSENGSPSILLKFMKKELVEKRDELISTGTHRYIENFVRTSKYDYQINDLQKLRQLLKYKEINLQDNEIVWLIQKEIEEQEYQDFEEKILDKHPTAKQEYLENYIKNYSQDTQENMEKLGRLFQKQKVSRIDLEKEVKEIRRINEIKEFERKLSNDEQGTVYEYTPVIDSNYNKDKALKDAQILSNLSILFYDMGKRDYTLNYLDKALSTYPNYIDAWKNKGLIYYTMGRLQKAVTCFYHVLTLDPECSEVWLDIGLILFEMGKVREAKQCYKKALEVQNGNLEELNPYTKQFLHENPSYQKVFDEFLKSVSSEEISRKTPVSSSTISKILELSKK